MSNYETELRPGAASCFSQSLPSVGERLRDRSFQGGGLSAAGVVTSRRNGGETNTAPLKMNEYEFNKADSNQRAGCGAGLPAVEKSTKLCVSLKLRPVGYEHQ